MAGTVSDRLIALKSVLTRDPVIRDVGLLPGLAAACGWHGLQRRKLLHAIRVEPCSASEGAFDWVSAGEHAVAWPRGVPPTRLVDALVELTVPSNGHYYFSHTAIKPGDHVVDVG